MEFLAGALLITLPRDKSIPLGAGAVLAKAVDGAVRAVTKPRSAHAAASIEQAGAQAVTLVWDRLTCILKTKNGQVRALLRDIQGTARPGRLLAILGPSGAGKTTLLNILAGQLPFNKNIELTGRVLANGRPLDSLLGHVGFVAQEDIFYSQLTVRETLLMAAQLSNGTSTASERERVVDDIIARLGLAKVRATRIGDKKTRGLSGGERKRLSIAVELIARPKLIFADEPTTGLDSFQAHKVVEALKQLAEENHTVIASIHQPRSSIYTLFDDVILLSEGEVLYAGEADRALSYFDAQGHRCPKHYNPAEFLADLAAVDHSSAAVFAGIYWRMGLDESTIQDRTGLLQVCAVGTAMSSLIKTLNVFPRERVIVQRERSRYNMPAWPYLLSKLAAELPVGALFPALFGCIVYPATGLNPSMARFSRFLAVLTLESFSAQALGLAVGAAAPSTEAALAIGPAAMLISIVFGGLFVNEANVPRVLSWLPKTSIIKYAFAGLCVNEFTGLKFTSNGAGPGLTGTQALKRLSFAGTSIGQSLVGQGRVLLFYYWLTYSILQRQTPKYQPVESARPSLESLAAPL
ncbi:hypothetical protein ACKKBF_B18545 [Auxenochlorella protothecoides x Auxenochlorella symbiontica]